MFVLRDSLAVPPDWLEPAEEAEVLTGGGRTVEVEAEDRAVEVEAEGRVAEVEAEGRVVEVEAEGREVEAECRDVREIVDQVSSSSSPGSPDNAMAVCKERSTLAGTAAGVGYLNVFSIAVPLQRRALSREECRCWKAQGNHLTVELVGRSATGEAGAESPER